MVTGGLIAEEFFKNEQVDNKKREKLDSHDSSSLIICSVNEKFSELEDYKTLSFIFDCNNNDENVKIKGGQDFEINTPNLLSKRYLNSDFSSTSSLKLTDDELSILHGRYTKNNKDIIISRAETLAMRVITKIASISNATKLIDVCSAHIDGVTFIGDGGLKFVQKLVEYGGKVKIPTTLNSQSVDRERWEVLGVEKSFALKANSVGDSYLKLGCHDSFTCAPYLLPSARPKYKQDIMWGESNAVVYSNSVIGARTEKYPDYFDILAALVGKVPYTGVHVTENRKPKIYLDVTKLVDSLIRSLSSNNEESEIESFFPTLGWLCGTLSDGKIPLILGLEKFKGSISDDHLKAFCAAFGSTGTAPLFHMVGVTPEASNYTLENHVTKIEISRDQLYHAYLSLDSAKNYDDNSKVDLIALGNPHLSIGEVRNLADLIKEDNRPKVKDVKVLTTLSRHILSEANKEGYTKILKDFGVTIISDTVSFFLCCALLYAIPCPGNSHMIQYFLLFFSHFGSVGEYIMFYSAV